MIARTADNVLSPLSYLRCNCNYNNIMDHCIHGCSFGAQERLNLWYEMFHLNTYLRSLDKTFLTLIFLGLEVDRVHSSFGSLYQMFRFLCLSNRHQMRTKVTQKRSSLRTFLLFFLLSLFIILYYYAYLRVGQFSVCSLA